MVTTCQIRTRQYTRNMLGLKFGTIQGTTLYFRSIKYNSQIIKLPVLYFRLIKLNSWASILLTMLSVITLVCLYYLAGGVWSIILIDSVEVNHNVKYNCHLNPRLVLAVKAYSYMNF